MSGAAVDGGAGDRLLRVWFRMLLRLYPPDFRSEVGAEMMAAYRERARAARGHGRLALVLLCVSALADSVRNGLGERLSPAVSWRRSGNWGRDAELVLRRLVRAPVFVLAVVGTLAVGLGAFGVVYSVVYQVLLAPLRYARPDDLYYIWRDYRPLFDADRGAAAGTDVVALQKAGGVIADAAALHLGRMTLAEAAGSHAAEITVLWTTPNLFRLLGVRPALGRAFRPEEIGPGRPPVVVLTHGLWQRLGADRSIMGRTLRLDDHPYTVVGVLGSDFELESSASLGKPTSPDAYVTFDYDLATTSPAAGSYSALIRARPGTAGTAVASAVAAVGRAIDRRDLHGRGVKFYPTRLASDLVARVRAPLVVIGWTGALLVLVLFLNLASLLLVRALEREREFAVARALGANPLALMRATLLEGAALGLLGGAAGAALAAWATKVAITLAPAGLPRRADVAVDGRIALTVTGIGLLLGLLAGVAPAVWGARTGLSALLGAAAVRGGGGGSGRARRGIVVAQVALSLTLLAAGGLVVRGFARLLHSDPGFDARGVLTLRVPLGDASAAEAEARQAAILRELAVIPGVTLAGAASDLPFSGHSSQTAVSFPEAPGNAGAPEADRPMVDYVCIRPGYLTAMRIRIVEGQALEPERRPGPTEALIDEQLARRFFPGSSPIGSAIVAGPDATDSLRIVGVVRHARLYDLEQDGRPQLYVRSEGDFSKPSLSYVVRSEQPPETLVPEVRAAVERVAPGLAISDVQPMQALVAASLTKQRVSAVLVGGFSLGALLLAAMGLFGVVAGSVTQRRHELAIRMALGADHGRVLRGVLAEGGRLVALGLLVGAPGVWLAGRLVRALLVGVSPWDPATLGAVALGLGAVAFLACWMPARRVIAIEPARALREE